MARARAQLGARGFEGRVRKFLPTNDDGTFTFRDVAEGSYTIRVEGGGDDQAYEAQVTKVEVRASQPATGLVVELKAKVMTTGTVDMSAVAERGESSR